MKKILFFITWALILVVGPVTVLKTVPLELLKNPTVMINFLQRIVGLLAFSLIFSQIVIGSIMNRLIEKFGVWVFKLHVIEGIFTYLLVLTHPILFVLLNWKLKGTIDPFYVFTDVCVICKTNLDLFYTFGRVSFWLVTLAVTAGLLRTEPWLRKNWRKFHYLNYLAFFLIAIHSYFVGSDVQSKPFIYFYYFSISIVAVVLFYKLIRKFKSA